MQTMRTTTSTTTTAPLLVGVVLAALAVTANVLPESSAQTDACGSHYDDIYAAAASWLGKSCEGDQKAACHLPEHETQYGELKQKCRQAVAERQQRMDRIKENLPGYISNVAVAIQQLNSTLKTDLSSLQTIVEEQRKLLENAWGYGVQLQRELLLTNMEADRTARALFYHSLLLEPALEQTIADSYRRHGANGDMIAMVLKFVRTLPAVGDRVVAYGQLADLLKSNGQNEHFPAVIFSLDVQALGAEANYKPDHGEFRGRALARWQSLLLGGNFSEVVTFATDFPVYYGQIGADLLSIISARWSKESFWKLVHLPRSLPDPAQRIAALKELLGALLKHQSEQHNDIYLMKLANELALLEDGLDADLRPRLDEVKTMFPQFSYNRDFQTYLELYGMVRILP